MITLQFISKYDLSAKTHIWIKISLTAQAKTTCSTVISMMKVEFMGSSNSWTHSINVHGNVNRSTGYSEQPTLVAQCFTSVASWWRLAWSIFITQRPWRSRRLLSHQVRRGEGSTVGLVSRSTDWPIKVQAGSQQGPHTIVYRFMLAAQKEY